jgi:translation initiation factor eIF-2B subunit delta
MRLSGLKKAVDEIAADKQSGATALSLKAIDVYIRYFKETTVSNKADFLYNVRKLGDMLKNAQPSMASVNNVVELVSEQACIDRALSLTELKSCLSDFLASLKSDIVKAKTQIALNTLGCIPDNAVIITLSESSTVEEIIKQAFAAGKVSRVIVAESRPLCEGLNFAGRLLKLGVPVTIIVDAALGFFCKDADLAIVGADAIQSDGSVIHKVGTYTLALACHDLNKPFYVVCDTLKISKTKNQNEHVLIEIKPSDEVVKSNKLIGADIKNIYFDITPSKYITGIITEKGHLHL